MATEDLHPDVQGNSSTSSRRWGPWCWWPDYPEFRSREDAMRQTRPRLRQGHEVEGATMTLALLRPQASRSLISALRSVDTRD
jgi:hypothetical protein